MLETYHVDNSNAGTFEANKYRRLHVSQRLPSAAYYSRNNNSLGQNKSSSCCRSGLSDQSLCIVSSILSSKQVPIGLHFHNPFQSPDQQIRHTPPSFHRNMQKGGAWSIPRLTIQTSAHLDRCVPWQIFNWATPNTCRLNKYKIV
jgi:hypothetical protein